MANNDNILTKEELNRYFELDEKVKKVVEKIAPLCTDIPSREEIESIEDGKNGKITIYVYSPEFGHDWYEISKNYLFMSDAEIKNELREAIDKEFPQKAFPYREIEDTITLWQSIREFHTFKVIEESKEKAAIGAEQGINSGKNIMKSEHPEWYSATGSLGLRDFQIDAFGVKDAEMERHFVKNMNSEIINRLDDQNRRDMRNWLDEDEEN